MSDGFYGTSSTKPDSKLSRNQKVFWVSKAEKEQRNESVTATKFQKRLQSFNNSNWKSRKSIITLAMAGFRYTGSEDRVECEMCLKRIFQWLDEDDPLETHFRISPECGFMKSLGYSIDLQIPKYNKYSQYQIRMESMSNIPSEYQKDLPSINLIVLSGFFYQGTLDRMSCFHCGLVLRDWESDTIPNEVHVQFAKNCLFIMNVIERETHGKNIKLKFRNNSTSNNVSKINANTTSITKTFDKCQITERPEKSNSQNLTQMLNPCQTLIEVTDSCQGSSPNKNPILTIIESKYPQQQSQSFIQRPIGRFAVSPPEVDADNVDSQRTDQRNSTSPNYQTSTIRNSACVTSGAISSPAITPIEEAVHEMGYSLEIINQAITERMDRGDGEFPDATSLCLAVMDLDEKKDH